MQFGVQFFPAVDHTDKSAADYYAESLAIAEEAETLGLTHARTVEHYFTRYGAYNPHPSVVLTPLPPRPARIGPLPRSLPPRLQYPVQHPCGTPTVRRTSGGRCDGRCALASL